MNTTEENLKKLINNEDGEYFLRFVGMSVLHPTKII